MQELAQALQEEQNNLSGYEKEHIVTDEGLRIAGQKWASYCLQTYDDVLLNKALKISEAISNFLNERERGALK